MSQDRPKVPVLWIGTGNGASNCAMYLNKKGDDIVAPEDNCKQIVVDPDGRKTDLLLGNPNVQVIDLVEEQKRAFGTGGSVNLGRELARAKQSVFQGLIRPIKEQYGVFYLHACAGGGSAGALLEIAEIISQGDPALAVAQIAIPSEDEGLNRMRMAYEVVAGLRDLNIPVNIIRSQSLPRSDTDTTKNVHDQINQQTLVPIFTMFRHVFHRTGNVVNTDYNDLKSILERGSLMYIGLYSVQRSEQLDPTKITKALVSHRLQDGDLILPMANRAILWAEGAWPDKTLNAIKNGVKEKMHDPKNNENLWLKCGINQEDGSSRPEWIGLIAVSERSREENLGQDEQDLSGIGIYRLQDHRKKQEVVRLPILISGEERPHEKLVLVETLFSNPAWESFTLRKKIMLPESLVARIADLRSREPLLPAQEVRTLCASVQTYIDHDPYLKGAKLYFPPQRIQTEENLETERIERSTAAAS